MCAISLERQYFTTLWGFEYLYIHNISDIHICGLSITKETQMVEMHIWCIKIGIVWILHKEYILVSADKACISIVVVCKIYYYKSILN
jgi:hypothetical protein